MIPCFECICLAICKSKETIYCPILHEFMDENTEYDDIDIGGDFIKTKKGIQTWNEVEELFRKDGIKITIDSDNSFDSFTIYPEGTGRDDYEHYEE